MSDAEQTEELRPANENPWYCLATLYGERPKTSFDDPSEWRTAKLIEKKNRMGWNRWIAGALSDQRRAALVEKGFPETEVVPFTPEEKKEFLIAFASRRGQTDAVPPDPNHHVDFSNTEFHFADFTGFLFSGEVLFDSAIFCVSARFDSATFSGIANFNATEFSEIASFRKATFCQEAKFQSATFRLADFTSAMFSGNVAFNFAMFSEIAFFNSTVFCGWSEFRSTTFSREALFASARFSEGADFSSVTAFGCANFLSATFSTYVHFNCATFSGDAIFNSATFFRDADFKSATFSRDVTFDSASFSDDAFFDSASLSGSTSFLFASFSKGQYFLNTEFKARTVFANAKFLKFVPDFRGAKMHEATEWHGVTWPDPPDNRIDAQPQVYAYERLKQEMERLKKHEDEQFFFRKELRARRGLEPPKSLAWWINYIYELLSDYGQSVVRPLFWLFMLFLFGVIAETGNFNQQPHAIWASSKAQFREYFPVSAHQTRVS